MGKIQDYNGYQEDFLGQDAIVPLPDLSDALKARVAPVKDASDNVLRYQNYSVVQDAQRKFPIYTAANIDGGLFKELRRKDIFPGGRDRWRRDPRLDKMHQWGYELYAAPKSDFDRGHMTKREDVQWGSTMEDARLAARSTFIYTNSVPQLPELNRAVWRILEDYILLKETIALGLKINLFTGPVLRDDDPVFLSKVKREEVQLPVFFWKVIYLLKSDRQPYRVAFLIGQEQLLYRHNIVRPAPVPRDLAPSVPEEIPFMDFSQADTYQVNVSLLESLTGMTFSPAQEPFADRRPSQLTLEETSMRGVGGEAQTMIQGLVL